MQTTQYLLLLLFSCLTGWLTVRTFFILALWPLKPTSVLGFRVQGFFPKNQPLIAGQIAERLSKDLLSFHTFKEKAAAPAAFEKLKPEIEYHIDHFLREKLKDSFPMLAMFIGDKTINQMKAAFLTELESLFPVIMRSYVDNLEKDINPQSLIEEKLASFALEKSLFTANKSARKLFISSQLIGGSVGLALGLLQALFFMLLGR